LFTTAAFSQNVISLFNRANQFFDFLQAEKFADAHACFEDSTKNKITQENLKQLWTDISTKLGKAESLDAIQSKTQGEYFAVTVEGKFANGDQNFLLGFNKAEKIVGLFLAPKARGNAYLSPAYADTTLYTEKQLYINTPGHQLAAILTVPKNTKNFPIVVFVHGSGPSDMDESIGPNKPFKDISAGLAAQGIASLRYVKRTLVYPNEFGKSFTVKEEVVDDAVAALNLAKTVPNADLKNIYLFGHSLGGMLAPKIAGLVPNLNGIILAAAPARKLTDMIAEQSKYLMGKTSDTSALIKKQNQMILGEIEKSRFTQLGAMKPDSLVLGLPASYWVDLNAYDQVAAAQKLIKTRILVVQGGNDYQVSKQDYDFWNSNLSTKGNAEFKFYPALNHLFSVQMEKGTSEQYLYPSSVSATFINDLVAWIKIQ